MAWWQREGGHSPSAVSQAAMLASLPHPPGCHRPYSSRWGGTETRDARCPCSYITHLLPGCSPPSSLLLADFNYGAEDYDAEGNEEPKALPEGSETMPYIDESPTMSPQLSARGQESGDGVSPTPADGLSTGVGGLGTKLGIRTCENRGWDVSSFLVMVWC